MLGLTTRLSHLQFSPGRRIRIHSIPKNFTYKSVGDLKLRYLPPLKSKTRINCAQSSLVYAGCDGNGNGNGKGNENWNGGNGDEENEKKGEERPRSNMRWPDLVPDLDPIHIMKAVLIDRVKVFWQQFCEISASIDVAMECCIAGFKYSIAALFIVVFVTFFSVSTSFFF